MFNMESEMQEQQEMQEINPVSREQEEAAAREPALPVYRDEEAAAQQPALPPPVTFRSKHSSSKRTRLMVALLVGVIILCLLCFATFITVVYLAATQAGGQTKDEGSPKKPHIVFVLADDLGYNDIGYTNPDVLTPHLTSLAKTGRILTNHYMVPVCTPSRHSLMTGIYAYKAKMQHFVLADDTPHCSPTDLEFLPQKLKAAGYSSHLMGKWHLGFCQWDCTPTLRGFDSWFGLYAGEGEQWTHDSIAPDIIRYDWRLNAKPYFEANGTHTTDLVTNRAIDILQNHKGSKTPMFLLLAHTVPHHPLEAPQKFIDLYPDEPDPQRKIVLGMMSHLDYNVGRLMETLKQEGLYDDTLLIFASDNGGDVPYKHDNWPYRGGKGSLFEGGTHTVSFVHGPMLKDTATKHDGMFHVLDWHSTILGLAGADTAGGDGLDQSDLILNGGPTKRTDFVVNIDMVDPEYFGQAAIRMGDWKIIWGFEGYADGWGLEAVPAWDYPPNLELLGINPADTDVNQTVQNERWVDLINLKRFDPQDISSGWVNLFNIADDPYERKDLSEDPDQQSRILQMKQQILAYLQGYVAPGNASLQHWSPQAEEVMVDDVWTPGWCNQLDLSI